MLHGNCRICSTSVHIRRTETGIYGPKYWNDWNGLGPFVVHEDVPLTRESGRS